MSISNPLPLALVPGDSFIHNVSPGPKMILVVGYVILAFSTQNIIILYSMAAIAFIFAIWAGILKTFLKGLLILLPIGSSLLALQILAPAVEKPWTAAAELGPVTLYIDGLYYGFVLLGRIFASLAIALVMLMTTHPSDMFTTFTKLRVPYTLNFMQAMTLQLIPVFQREVGIILSAQKSRGMKGSGFSAVLPSFIPVFVGAIERVQQLSISLESRGFGSTGHKTSYRKVKGKWSDTAIAVCSIVIMATLAVMSITRGSWNLSDQITFSANFVLGLFLLVAGTFLTIVTVTIAFMFRK
ncbi:MAG: energy-coupling factor transporter transmembrane protein EcfT [Rhizobiaceae bacterium]|nr:energy-coupling factor transporter transmembrane protein EcfT [Rhizobiaceae bacterium]